MKTQMTKPAADQSLTFAFTVDQTPEEAFAAIKDVGAWWTAKVEGKTEKVGDEFTYQYEDKHYSKQRLVESIPGKKVVWLVLDESNLSFTKDTGEWNGTQLCFEVSRKGKKTEVRFTHLGLMPELECFEACSMGWGFYIKESLRTFIATGKGLRFGEARA
jgi:hypothetical protein